MSHTHSLIKGEKSDRLSTFRHCFFFLNQEEVYAEPRKPGNTLSKDIRGGYCGGARFHKVVSQVFKN